MKQIKTTKLNIYHNKSLLHFLRKYNFVISIILFAGVLTFCIITLSNILTIIYTDDDISSPTTENQSTTMFNPTVVNELNGLNTSSSNTSYKNANSIGRTNPFAE